MLQPPHPPQHHTRMYLNLPPVAALHTEWRSSCGGLPRGFSGLPLCFNDSDSDLSTTGTPISEKVQMIIESLRSTQSSLNMGDETEGNQVLSGQLVQEAGARGSQGQGFKVRRGPPVVMGPKPKFRGPLPLTHTDNLPALPEVSYNVDSESSDGDDSVDRGIEEAIQEYLKEKDDHKRKAEPEPATNILQPPKIPRREAAPTFPEPTKQHSDSNKILTASNQVLRSVQTETHNTALPMKKCLKSKIPTCKENPWKLDTISNTAVVKKQSLEQKRGPSNSNPLSDKQKIPVLKAVKLEEHLSDSDSSSSSDDGIEEAIQRYQQEKKKERHEGGPKSSIPLLVFKEESDSSSSDDGIEEAIRHYQLEKQKEKGVPTLSLFLPKQKQLGKAAAPLHCSESTSTQASAMKKHKLSKKKKPETRDLKSSLPSQTPGSSLSLIKKRLAVSSPKGNGLLLSTKVEPLREREQEQHTTPCPATLKVNTTTTAELMCAEAILDISKAVINMPGAFNPNVASAGHININSSSTESTATTSLFSTNCHDDDDDNNTSDDESSIDSEDGIEQEIRKFLENKAQMHKLPSGPGSDVGTTSPGGTNTITEPEKNTKLSPAQKKTLRLSVKQKINLKEEVGSRRGSKEGESHLKMKEEVLRKHLTKHDQRSRSSVSNLKKSPLKSVMRGEPKSGDKSSSLDSDEDLDTAIKDLLKTKKKLKKKTRDMKLKSRKGLEDEKPLSRKTELKKLGMDHVPKTTSLLKTSLKITTTTAQSSNNNRKKGTFSTNVSQYPQSNEKKEPLNQTDEMDRSQGNRDVEGLSRETIPVVQIKEESSSVDSDDSIEQEIRKFLAEKAKVSTTTVKTDDREEIVNGKGKTAVPLKEKCIKLENLLAEIPRIDVAQFPDLPRQSSCEQRGVPERGIFPNTPPIQPVPGNHTPETARGSCLLSTLTPSSYPPALEPANAAVSGAARSEKRKSSSSDPGSGDTHLSANSEMAREHSYRSFPSTSYPLSRTDSEQWRKSQVIPTTETKEKIHNRNPFQYSSPSFGEKRATTPAYQCVVPASIYSRRRNIEPAPDTPVSTRPAAVRTGSSIRSPLVPFHRPSSSETISTSAAVFSSPFPSLTRRPTETGPSGRYFLQGHESGSRWSQSPTLTPGLSESSVVHVAKDKTMFVELFTNETNHVQVRSREVKVSEGKEERRRDLPAGESERERECRKTEQIGRRGEECVDETDVSESDERTSPEQQGFHTLSLSSSIDPGITLSPYIALNTEERSKRFRWMCKAVAVNQPKKTKFEKPVKRMLQFLPLSRKNKATGK